MPDAEALECGVQLRHMQVPGHSFNWKGFYFALGIIAACVGVGIGGHYGEILAQRAMNPLPPPQLAVAKEAPAPAADIAPAALSSATPLRIINSLTIADTVPAAGKFIAADLVHMKLYLYEDGTTTAEYPITTKGRPGTPWETPSGFYSIQTKEVEHFSTIGKVYMPFSMQFYGNYFIHGHTYYPDGSPTSSTFSGGCIRLETADAEKVFAFADVGTKVFVYDSPQAEPPAPLEVEAPQAPLVSADSYLIADIDTGDVYAEENATEVRPISSATKLMTALVANEIISFNKSLAVPQGALVNPPNDEDTTEKTFLVGDLFYPLLMQEGDGIADALAGYYGRRGFVHWMNTTAKALDMTSTTYADASGASSGNTSNAEDLFRLATYLANKKSFVLKITGTENKTITSDDGASYEIQNMNMPGALADEPAASPLAAASSTQVSVLSFKVGGVTRRAGIILLGSSNQAEDAQSLSEWITASAREPASETACASCAETPHYRKIEL